MKPAEAVDKLHKSTNTPQRVIVALAVPILAILIGYGAIHLIANAMRGGYWLHDCTPLALIHTWWMWAIVLGIVGVFEFFWFRTRQSEGTK